MKNKESILFLSLFFTIVILLDILVGIYMVNWNNPVNILQFIILQFVNFGIAYGVTELIMIVALKEKYPHRLKKLEGFPPLALLYLTYNDVMPHLLAGLKNQTYRNYDVFVLDDSTDEKCKGTVDSSGYRVIRRKERKGFKAGAINNWLWKYGNKYKYFIVLDSDSLIKNDFVENMVKYAEHPKNRKIGIFQSLIEIWNKDMKFSETLGNITPLWNYGIGKLANNFDTNLTWGHNCLYRTDVMMMIKGFDTKFVAEDFATSIKVIERGYKCRIVNETSYESMPQTPRDYTKRMIRWCKGITEIMKSAEVENIPLTTKLYMSMSMYSYMIWFFYIPGMLIATLGYESNLSHTADMIAFIVTGRFFYTPLLPSFLIIFFYIAYFMFLKLPIALKLGIGVKNYFKSLILLTSLGFYMLFPIIKAQILTVIGKKSTFEVTPKIGHRVKFSDILNEMKYSIILIVFLIIGIIRNPISLVFNFFWVVPFVASPIILYLICCRDKN